jgi:hypothetical protein
MGPKHGKFLICKIDPIAGAFFQASQISDSLFPASCEPRCARWTRPKALLRYRHGCLLLGIHWKGKRVLRYPFSIKYVNCEEAFKDS